MADRSQEIWNFALALYQQPGVEALCLELQQRGANTSLVLWCQWLARQHIELAPALLAAAEAALETWHNEIVEPLRQARRALKRQSASKAQDHIGALNRGLKQVEIDAERVEYSLLSDLEPLLRRDTLSGDHNLRCYLQSLGLQQLDEQWFKILGQLPCVSSH